MFTIHYEPKGAMRRGTDVQTLAEVIGKVRQWADDSTAAADLFLPERQRIEVKARWRRVLAALGEGNVTAANVAGVPLNLTVTDHRP